MRLTIPPKLALSAVEVRTVIANVIAKTKISFAILPRADSPPLCFAMMKIVAVMKAKRIQNIPSAGTAAGRNRLAPMMDSRSKAEIKRECLWRKEGIQENKSLNN
jgi:hypothetical protein